MRSIGDTSSRRRPGPIPRNLSVTRSCRCPSPKDNPVVMGPGLRRDDHVETRVRILAARFARALHHSLPSRKTEGAGKAGWPLHPGPCAKKIAQAQEPQVQAVITPALPAQWFSGLYVILCLQNLPECANGRF